MWSKPHGRTRWQSQQDYLTALPDIEAALNSARLQNSHMILWGSSSVSLIFRIAADTSDLVTALLAFPPEIFSRQAF